jgi:Rieske Fe-S protein
VTFNADTDPEVDMGEHGREMSRRVLIRGAALTGVVVPVLVACGTDEDTDDNGRAAGSPDEADSPESPQADQSGDATTVATSDVPVGGGTILAEEMVVVTQPSEGEFVAFSAVCTHQGCPVQSVSDGTINCQCHGSAFAIEDGSVVNGPATRPLESKSVTVEGDSVRVS